MNEFSSEIEKEYRAAKESVVWMNRPDVGHLKVTGNDHVDLLHRITTNELRYLKPGEGQVNMFTNEKGRIVDRVFLYKFENEIRLLTSPKNSEKLNSWIDKYVFIEDVKVEDLTESVGMLSLFGPKSANFLARFFNHNFEELKSNHFKEVDWQENSLIITRTEELNLPGFYLICESNVLPALQDVLLKEGNELGLSTLSDAAYDVLRIEAGWPRFGKDFDAEVNPHEAQMLPYVNFDKGCYIGQEVVARLDTYEKVQKYLMGIIVEADAQPNEKDPIFIDGNDVGKLTSVTYCFDLKKSIALGYVKTRFISEGTEVQVQSDDEKIIGKLVRLPFSAK